LVLPFWYRLTWVVPEKGSLDVCVCVILSAALKALSVGCWCFSFSLVHCYLLVLILHVDNAQVTCMNRKLWCLDLSGGSVPQGRHAALMAVKFGMEVDSSMPYFTSICAGIGVWGAEN